MWRPAQALLCMSARGWLHYYLQAFHLLCAGGRHHSTPKCNIHPQQSSPGPTATGTFHMSQSFYMSRVSMLRLHCVYCSISNHMVTRVNRYKHIILHRCTVCHGNQCTAVVGLPLCTGSCQDQCSSILSSSV